MSLPQYALMKPVERTTHQSRNKSRGYNFQSAQRPDPAAPHLAQSQNIRQARPNPHRRFPLWIWQEVLKNQTQSDMEELICKGLEKNSFRSYTSLLIWTMMMVLAPAWHHCEKDAEDSRLSEKMACFSTFEFKHSHVFSPDTVALTTMLSAKRKNCSVFGAQPKPAKRMGGWDVTVRHVYRMSTWYLHLQT